MEEKFNKIFFYISYVDIFYLSNLGLNYIICIFRYNLYIKVNIKLCELYII